MTKLEKHQSSKTTKLLLLGDRGAGKTGALASLAQAGYNIWIVDLDNGVDVLANILKKSGNPYGSEALSRVHFKTITDSGKNSGGKLIPTKATVWPRTIKLISGEDKWDEEQEPGSILTWGEKDILVIDSLSFLSEAAMDYILMLNMRLGQKPWQSDYGDGQQLVKGLLNTIKDENVKCNVIVMAHITYIGEENALPQGYPNSIGKALPPLIGGYFNSMLQVKSTGSGASVKRKILVNTQGQVELKNSAPLNVKKEYDHAFGLAEFFRDVRGESSPGVGGSAATPAKA